MSRLIVYVTLIVAFIVVTANCSTAPITGRKQLSFVPADQLNAMGTQAFDQVLKQQKTVKDPATENYVKCVVDPLINYVSSTYPNFPKQWRLAVLDDSTPNAFVVPGGNMGVNKGILTVAKNDAQLAAVLGHELGHQLANHAGERASQELAAQGGLAAVSGVLLSDMTAAKRNALIAALGAGTQIGVLLPYSRTQESEADAIGQRIMANAGFNPQESVELWKNMQAATKGQTPPEFLSTHPDPANRIQHLEQMMPGAIADYTKNASGRSPASEHRCQRPPGT